MYYLNSTYRTAILSYERTKQTESHLSPGKPPVRLDHTAPDLWLNIYKFCPDDSNRTVSEIEARKNGREQKIIFILS